MQSLRCLASFEPRLSSPLALDQWDGALWKWDSLLHAATVKREATTRLRDGESPWLARPAAAAASKATMNFSPYSEKLSSVS